MNNSLFAHNSDEWRTPEELFEDLDEYYHFGLDVAATDKNHLCDKWFTKELDGLNQSWKCDGYVWCNPPYSQVSKWVEKAYKENVLGADIVMLIPARTDTQWFHKYIYTNPFCRVEFIKGRLKFEDENGNSHGNAPFPSMIAIFD